MKKAQKAGTSEAYAKAGVNLKSGEAFSAFAGAIGRASFGNSQYVVVQDYSKGHFRGPRGFKYVGLPEGYFEIVAPDGIGTATIIVSAAGAHYSAASRLLAMTAGDITRHGGLPLVFTNVLETKTLGDTGTPLFSAFQDMMAGLGEYAYKQRLVLIGGETAEMNDCVSGEIIGPATETMPTYNWSGVMCGVNHPDKIITGDGLKPGQQVIALRDGLRSNGGSMARKFLRHRYGNFWWYKDEARNMVAEMASPAVLYDHFLAKMNGWFTPGFKPIIRTHAIAHLSGGGVRSKFFEDLLLPRGLSADLDDLWTPPSFMADCVNTMGISNEEAYTVFNGGQGALVVVDGSDVHEFCRLAKNHSVDARLAGSIAKKFRVPRVMIRSKFDDKFFTMR